MKCITYILIIVSVVVHLEAQTVLIKDAQLVQVEDASITPSTDVLISKGKILKIADDLSAVSVDTVISADGRYLCPGLIDAHIHLFQSGGLYTRPDAINLSHIRPYKEERQWLRDHAEEIMRSYLRVGVTGVVDVGGPMYQYDERVKFEILEGLPDLYMTGPLVSTYLPPELDVEDPPIVKVETKEAARELVRKQVPLKPDFIKIWYISLPSQSAESTYDIVKATIKEADYHDLRVAVHATQLNTAKLAIKAGADVLVHSVSDPLDEEFVSMLVDSGVVLVPTLTVHGNYNLAFTGEIEFQKEDFDIVSPEVIGWLQDVKHISDPYLDQLKKYAAQYISLDQKSDAIRKSNLALLADSDAIVATGTDAGNIGTLHASSYVEELEAMRKAGLSDEYLLKASTIGGAHAAGVADKAGQIKQGMKADLLILSKNPLEDVLVATRPDIVIKGGKAVMMDTDPYDSPEDLAQRQLNAYNAGNIDEFVEPYADDVEIYTFPDELRYTGKDQMRKSYGQFFESTPNLHCELVNRIVQGNTVIDQERVTGLGEGRVIEAIAIYKIENGKIKKVYFTQ